MAGRKKEKVQHYYDYTIIISVLLLFGIGLIMIYSTSSYQATLDYGDAAYYLKKQAIAGAIGFVFMLIFSLIDYRIYRKLFLFTVPLSIIMIFLVLTPLGVTVKGARRWLDVGIGFRFQPAEVVKLCMIIYTAAMVCIAGQKVIETFVGTLKIVIIPMIMGALVWKITDNLSSGFIIVGIAAVMVFVATRNYKVYIFSGIGAALLATGLVYYIKQTANVESSGFRAARILAWLDPEAYASGKGYQTVQALYAIGNGGYFGKGLGESMQKLGFIPEAQNDMIFSIICEEMGLVGASIIIFLFLFLIFKCSIVAYNASDMFGGFLVIGVIAHIAIQVFLNIAVVTNLIPNTGISLPFISYGGSSILFLFIEMGLVFSVSRQIKLD